MPSSKALISNSLAFTKASTLSSPLLKALSDVCEVILRASHIFGRLLCWALLLPLLCFRLLFEGAPFDMVRDNGLDPNFLESQTGFPSLASYQSRFDAEMVGIAHRREVK